MRLHTTLLAAACTLLPVAAVQAQRTPPAPADMAQHQVQRYTALLSLTPEQQTEATNIFTAEATSSQALRASERTLHQSLHTAVANGDLASITETSTRLGQIEGEMIAARAMADAKFHQLLNHDQQTRISAFEGSHGEGHGFGGPGGPGGPGAPMPQ
jgi:hypothetical protein